MKSSLFLLLTLSLTSLGCRPEKPIEVSTFPKPPDLMFVGIMISGETVWSVKAVNKRENMLKAKQSIIEFAKTLDFSANPENPRWTLPENWKKLDLQREFRVATFEIGDADEESERTQVILSKIRTGRQRQSPDDTIVANMNRWRKEMGVEEIFNYTINSSGNPEEVSAAGLVMPFLVKVDVNGQTMYFNQIEGKFQKRRRPPGMAGMMSGKMTQGPTRPDTGAAKKEDQATAQNDPESSADSSNLPLTFDSPKGWKRAPGTSMVLVRFLVGDEDKQAEVKISRFPGSVESVNWQSTVTMWQRQLGTPVSDPKQLEELTEIIPSGELKAKSIVVKGKDKNLGTSLLGVMVQNTKSEDKDKWFVKMQGPDETIAKQSANFKAFVETLKFK